MIYTDTGKPSGNANVHYYVYISDGLIQPLGVSFNRPLKPNTPFGTCIEYIKGLI